MARWRVATWNLDWWGRNKRRISPWDLLCRAKADVFAVQEIKGSEIPVLREHWLGEALFSQDLYAPATRRWMGCGLLLRSGTRVVGQGVIDDLPKPQRGLWARVELPSQGPMTVVSWHSPNRAGDGLATKMEAFKVMSGWLAQAKRPVVLGADINTWTDPVDLGEPKRGHEHFEEHAFVGKHPRHGLIDAYRAVLERQGRLEALRTWGSEGPLAVSHVLRGGVGHRMDRIFVSPDLTPIDGEYRWHEAVRAGSDHALHWVDLDDVSAARGR